jgi:DNA replication protein DnaC
MSHKDLNSLREHLNNLKNKKRIDQTSDINLEFYRNHESIRDLALSEKEFKQHFGVIVRMIKEREMMSINPKTPPFYRSQLIRNTNGKLEVISVPNAETYTLLQIKNHYLIRDFPDDKLKILIDTESIGKEIDQSKKAVLHYYEDVLKNPKRANGIFVYGAVGIGKTYTAIALANELAKREKWVAFVNCAEIAYKLKQGFDQPNSVNDAIVNKMKQADVLFLDDIGAEDEKI